MVERESNDLEDRSVPTISQLIAAQMDATGRSFRDLWRASGERVKHQTFQELRSAPPKSWPKNVETIRGMAAALDVTETAIVMAYARSLGVAVAGESVLAQQLPASAAQLTPAQRNAIVQLIRAITTQEGAEHETCTEEEQEPRPQEGSAKHGRPAGGDRARRSPPMKRGNVTRLNRPGQSVGPASGEMPPWDESKELAAFQPDPDDVE